MHKGQRLEAKFEFREPYLVAEQTEDITLVAVLCAKKYADAASWIEVRWISLRSKLVPRCPRIECGKVLIEGTQRNPMRVHPHAPEL
jgi:hypothetical protein